MAVLQWTHTTVPSPSPSPPLLPPSIARSPSRARVRNASHMCSLCVPVRVVVWLRRSSSSRRLVCEALSLSPLSVSLGSPSPWPFTTPLNRGAVNHGVAGPVTTIKSHKPPSPNLTHTTHKQRTPTHAHARAHTEAHAHRGGEQGSCVVTFIPRVSLPFFSESPGSHL